MPTFKQITSGVLITAVSLLVFNVVRRSLPASISDYFRG